MTNHLCDADFCADIHAAPSTGWQKPYILVKALYDLPANVELFVSYGSNYWSGLTKYFREKDPDFVHSSEKVSDHDDEDSDYVQSETDEK